eukprot:3974635-Amphidinium_carterae.1
MQMMLGLESPWAMPWARRSPCSIAMGSRSAYRACSQEPRRCHSPPQTKHKQMFRRRLYLFKTFTFTDPAKKVSSMATACVILNFMRTKSEELDPRERCPTTMQHWISSYSVTAHIAFSGTRIQTIPQSSSIARPAWVPTRPSNLYRMLSHMCGGLGK